MEMNPAIVVAAYDRPRSLSRLLSMLFAAEYPADSDVPLVISIDGGGVDEVVRIAYEFDWPFGKKEVVLHSRNLGLREHILRCGDLTEKFGAIIMLEDDLGVSKYFYQYAVQAYKRFSLDGDIVGVSLYKHLINVNSGARFEPLDNGLGYYLMQFPQSWGQVWWSRHWRDFRHWYDIEANRTKELDVPHYVDGWPESSWLKHYVRYMIDQDKQFVYPMKSLSTNFSDSGTHVRQQDNTYQVPLAECCPSLGNGEHRKVICYDAYFEITDGSLEVLFSEIRGSDVIVDLYGVKDLRRYSDGQLVLTVRPCSEYIKSYGLRLKPREMNVLLELPGREIFLARRRHVTDASHTTIIEREFSYDKRWLGLGNTLRLILRCGVHRIFGKS